MEKGLTRSTRTTAMAAAVALCVAYTQAVSAQAAAPDAAPSDSQAGDIVVTALKRATNVQATPLAITAVTGGQLTAMGVTDSDSLAKVSPGLVVREGSLSGARVTIRNIRAAGEATVGLYYDETPVMGSSGLNSDAGGTTPDIRLFDVDRVEVLRGPQGTLYGSSSMAGTVRLIFAKPRMNEVAATVAGQFSSVDGGGLGFENQAMVNVPLVNDVLSVRAVGFYRQTPGYIDDAKLGQRDVNDRNSRGGRVMVRFKPAPNLTIDGLATLQDTDGHLNDYYLAAGPYVSNFEAQEPVRDRFRLYSATLNWDLGPVTLTAVGSHSYRYFDYSYDLSAFFRIFGALYPVGSATNTAFTAQAPSVANSPQMTKTDTAEARLAGSGGGPLQWTVGAFYANRDTGSNSNILRASPGDGHVLPVSSATLLGQRVVTDRLKQIAGFAEVTYDLTHALSLTGGIRYYHYDRRLTGAVTVPDALVGFVAGAPTDQSSSESGWLYKANASYRIAPDLMVYATASSGQRPGGVNQNVSLPAALQSYQSDHLWNYEMGVKSAWLARALILNADVFQIDWDNMQTSGTLPNTNFGFIANAGRARVRGVEVEATVTPLAGLQFQLSGSYIDAKLIEDQSNQSLLAPGLKGDDIPSVPKVTAQGGVQYDRPISPTVKVVLRGDIYRSGSSWTEFRHTSAFQRFLPAYNLVSLRAGLGSIADDWNASLFVNNLLNDNTVVSKLGSNLYGGLDQVRAISNVPRTVGIDLTKHF